MTDGHAANDKAVALVIRFPRHVHRAARLRAFQYEQSLNRLVVQAVEQFLAAEQGTPAGDTRAGARG